MTDKTDLRQLLRLHRQTFVKSIFLQNDVTLFAHSPLLEIVRASTCVGGYVPMGSEADVMPLLDKLAQEGIALTLPCLEGKGDNMIFRRWAKGEDLIKQKQGFLQPLSNNEVTKPDVILLPLVGFDRAMNRLGQGAGHYDRLLAILPEAMRIGIAWSVQEVEAIPTDPWDIALDAVATEKEWIVGANSRINA